MGFLQPFSSQTPKVLHIVEVINLCFANLAICILEKSTPKAQYLSN
jgi:hypothetical protein